MNRILLTDLDDTLYSWVHSFAPSFRAMVGALSRESGFGEREILQSFRVAFRHEASVEFRRAIETNTLIAGLNPSARAELVEIGAEEFSREMNARVRAYAGVAQALIALRERGVRIVAVTNADAVAALTALDRLGLVPHLDGVVAWESGDPGRELSTEAYSARLTRHALACGVPWVEAIPGSSLKPSVDPYRVALGRLGVESENVWVIGDNRAKDLAPAEKLGLRTVWARYGERSESDGMRWSGDLHDSQVLARRIHAPMEFAPDFIVDQFSDVQSRVIV